MLKIVEKKVEKLTEAAEDAIVLECMKEALGSEEAIFVFIYTACEEATNGYSKMAEYSFKDLYLE